MDKKEFSISVIVAGLTILFVLASLALFISRGKSKYWTAKKMKLGVLILSFTTIAATQSSCRTCYEPMPPEELENMIYLAENIDTLNLNDLSTLSGTIENRVSEEFSFKLKNDTIDSIMQVNDIFPDDGSYDEYSEEFTINIDTSLQTGDYTLELFDVKKEKQDSVNYPKSEYVFKILNDTGSI